MSRPPHTWTGIHDPKLFNRDADEEADELADVFNIMCEREKEYIETFHINLAGITVNDKTQTNDQIETKMKDAIVKTRNQNADVIDILAKHIPDASRDYFARMTNSLHWYMQMGIISSARFALFELYDEAERDFSITQDEHFRNFCLNVSDTLSQDSLWQDKEILKNLAEKYKLMDEWGDLAESAANANDKNYKAKELIDLMLEEKPQAVKPDTKKKWRIVAESQARKYKADPAVYAVKVDSYLKQMIEREEMLAQLRVDKNRPLISYVHTVLDAAKEHVPAIVIFTSMDKRFQRSVIDFTVNALDRIVVQDIGKDSRVGAAEYAAIIAAKDEAIEELMEFRKNFADEAEDFEAASMARQNAKEEARNKALGEQQARDRKDFMGSDKAAAAMDAADAVPDAQKVQAAIAAADATPYNKPGKVRTTDIKTVVPPTPVISSTKPTNKPATVGEVVGK